jgi:hypothetical protein
MALVRLSCPDWKEGKVTPVTVEVPMRAQNRR